MKRLKIYMVIAWALIGLNGCLPTQAPSVTSTEEEPTSATTSGEVAGDRAGDQAGDQSGDQAGDQAGQSGGMVNPQALIPEPATLHRLSASELSTTIAQLFQVEIQTPLEADTRLHGFARVANAELTISPLLTEQLEELAWEVADQVTNSTERIQHIFPCTSTDEEDLTEDALARFESCLSAAILRLGHRVWRRPISSEELDAFMMLYRRISEIHPNPVEGRVTAQGAVIAAFLQAPDFVFRVELGEPESEINPEEVTWRYTDDEMASRLSYLLWGQAPDDELLAAASAGTLTQDEGVRAQANRLLNDPRAAQHLASFFDELIGLPNLDAVSKDAQLFPEFSASLRDSMRHEIAELFRDVVFDRDADIRELLTSERASLDAELASLYGVEIPADLAEGTRFITELPADQLRGGLIGRIAPLTLFSHATVNSPTYRGRFVRSGLLCQDVPPPPEGVITELEEPEGGEAQTLRQRLERHATDPLCAGCHQLMDPLGYPLERFDPLGRWRSLDHGLPIDTSGELDGVMVNDARSLGAAVADAPDYADCMTRRLYRYAVAHLESEPELTLIGELYDHLIGPADYRLKTLLIEIIMSDGFRRLAPPTPMMDATGEVVTAAGCGGVERCDGADNDCDGEIDEGVVRACDTSCQRSGIERCTGDGAWSACEAGPPPHEVCDGEDNDCDGEVDEGVDVLPERCDGADNDCDGAIDEEVSVSAHQVDYTYLSTLHPNCQSDSSNRSDCNAAINRFCQALGCGGTGFGPVETNGWTVDVICLPESYILNQWTPYQELASRHDVCDGQREYVGPNCNAAMHRQCRELGHRTGFGPLERSATHAAVACVPQADVIHTTYTELSTYHEACQRDGERIGNNCNAAIHRLCRARGNLSGWGPLENSQDVAVVACVSDAQDHQ